MDTRLLLLLFSSIGATVAAFATRVGYFGFNRVFQFTLFAILLPVLCRFHRRIFIILKTLPRDTKFLYRCLNLEWRLKTYSRNNVTAMKIFRERAARYPDLPCFIFEERIWTNADINKYSNQVASVFQKAGYVKGDVVALLMPNRPEYVAICLGLGKLGIVTALINTNLRQQPLIHCLTVVKIKCIIYADEFSSAINDIAESIRDIMKYKLRDDLESCEDGVHNLKLLMSKESTNEPIVKNGPGYRDNFLYVYTSGTTGLPKASILPNSRYLLIAGATFNLLGLRSDDILYNPNPLYHVSGGLIGTSAAIVYGVPSVLRTKFSVSAYWTDCIKHKCTVTLYIGEMCRYLLNAKPRPEDSQHCVRMMTGNGMKPQIWRDFVKRFKIKDVLEIYGSSEGNANMVNIGNKIGAVGFMPSLLPKFLQPMAIIRVNPETYEPIRSADGLCVRAETNEPGMFVGLIKQGNALREFNGYSDRDASRKKIIENVFTYGDKAFLTGDILVQDEYGYYYFKDRVGDTFRWKGENVATAEVENVISSAAGRRNTIVYGVQVPGMEGRAGMAAIVDPDNLLDLKALAAELEKVLPTYARPIFLRIVKELEMTGTFKPKKMNLQKEGFDPNKIQDKLYFLSNHKEYVEITPELYQEIISGAKKF